MSLPQVPAYPAVAAQLKKAFEVELTTDKWAAAETAYALATILREIDIAQTRRWLEILLGLLRELPSRTLQDCATRRTKVGNVFLPDYLHEGVVKSRFEGLLRTLD